MAILTSTLVYAGIAAAVVGGYSAYKSNDTKRKASGLRNAQNAQIASNEKIASDNRAAAAQATKDAAAKAGSDRRKNRRRSQDNSTVRTSKLGLSVKDRSQTNLKTLTGE